MMRRYWLLSAILVAFTIGNLYGEQGRIRFIAPAAAQAEGLSAGDVVIRLSGDCGNGFSEVSEADGKTILGTVAANMNQGGTGGADTITPEGTVAAPTFTGAALAGHSHGVGTYATDAHAGTAVADHASHTHTYTDVPNHVHGFTDVRGNTTGGQTTAHGFTEGNDTSSSLTSTQTGNPTNGVATGTTAGPSAALTHSVTQPSAHTLSGSSQSVSGGTPAGTNSAPAFTGTQFDNRSAFLRVIFCEKS